MRGLHKTFLAVKGLKDHLLSGACPAPEKLRQLECPPEAPAGAGEGTALHPRQQMLLDTVLTHTALGVGRTERAQDFLSYCALCGFWTADHTKIKSHIRQAHRTQWSSHGNATTEACKRAGIPLIKGQPCPCCRKTVHDKNGHASQCAVLFQILFYDFAHGLKRTNKHLLDAHFRALPRTETPALRRPPSLDSPADPPASTGGPGGEPPCLPRSLLNPSNYCYVNALLSALIPTGILTAASASTGSAQHMEQRSWPHLCAGRRTHTNRLHLHLPQLAPRASEASQARPSVGIGRMEEGRAYPNPCRGSASPALEPPQRITRCSSVLRLLFGGSGQGS